MSLRSGWTAENNESRALQNGVSCRRWMVDRHKPIDVLSLLDVVQVKTPLLPFAFVGFLSSRLESRDKMLVSGGDEFLGEPIPFIHAINWVESFPFGVSRDEGCIDDRRFFKHELLACSTAPGLGVGLLVDPLEDWRPEADVLADPGRRAVAEPIRDPL